MLRPNPVETTRSAEGNSYPSRVSIMVYILHISLAVIVNCSLREVNMVFAKKIQEEPQGYDKYHELIETTNSRSCI